MRPTRRQFLGGVGALAAGAIGGWGCSGGSSGAKADDSPVTGGTSSTTAAGELSSDTTVTTAAPVPVSTDPPPAIAYARIDQPVTLPDNGVAPVDTGTPAEAGPLRLLIYPDYIAPGVVERFQSSFGAAVEVSYYDEVDAAFEILRDPASTADLVVGLPSLHINDLVLDGLIQPLNHDLLPNAENVLEWLRSPYYDVGSRYSLPYSVYTTGITYRRDLIGDTVFNRDDAWALLWDTTYAGKVGLLPDVRDGLALGLLVNGVVDLNTGDDSEIARAGAVLEKLVAAVAPGFDVYSYEQIPAGKVVLHQAWSGDMLTARASYLAAGQDDSILGYWHPTRCQVNSDMYVVPARSASPVLAQTFMNFMLDPQQAKDNFAAIGFQPAVANPSAFDLVSAGLVPEHLLSTLVYDADVSIGYRTDPIAPSAAAKWAAAWNRITG